MIEISPHRYGIIVFGLLPDTALGVAVFCCLQCRDVATETIGQRWKLLKSECSIAC